ncbi:MAG: aminotransferase class IV [Deltaproteobacteria bacterium]
MGRFALINLCRTVVQEYDRDEEYGKIFSYQRDHVVETSELTLPFADDVGGTIRGYRIFTACRTVNKKIFRLQDHLDRLYRCASSIYMEPPLPREELRSVLEDLIEKNFQESPEQDLHIEVIFSGGLANDGLKPSGQGAHLYIAVKQLVRPVSELYEKGVVLATFPHQRMWADVKLLNYVGAVLAHRTVVPQHSAFDVLFVDPDDRRTILEGSTFTVFFVLSDRIILTPPLNGKILDSITRRVVLEVLEPERDLEVRETPVSLDQLSSLPEAFLASTTRNVLPVVRIDNHVIGHGSPGPVTKHVMALFDTYLASY